MMAGIGDMLLNMLGNKDPKEALVAQALGAGGGAAGTGTAPVGGAGTDAAGAQPQPSTYSSPPELMELYTQLMDRSRKASMVDRGIGLLGGAFAQPENRAGIMAAFSGGSGGGDGGGDDPMTLIKSITEMRATNAALAQKAAMRATLPAIAKEHGIDLQTAQYLFDTGKLDSVLQDAMKPDKQIVTLEDGTSVIVDKTSGGMSEPFGVPKKREIEIIKDDRGNQFPVYKDSGERVGTNNIVDGQGATENEQLWRADEADRAARGLPSRPLTEFIKETGRNRAGAANLGATGIDYGTPPKDMAWKRTEDGSIAVDASGAPIAIPIAGSPLDAENKAATEKAAQRGSQKDVVSSFVNQSIDDSLNLIKEGSQNWTTPVTGFTGMAAGYVPGSTAYNLKETLNTVKANLGFEKLQQMREASPTGGALGQVSDFENKLLQSTFGSLEQAQGNEQLVRNLYRVRYMTDAIVNQGIAPEDGGKIEDIFKKADREAAAFLGQEQPKSETGNVDALIEKYRNK